jgi:RNA polymerase sigma-70 factor (ECF subfamily)
MDFDLQDLCRQAQRGDETAARGLVDRTYQRIYAFLRRMADSDADAADLTQRTYQRAWQSLPDFKARCSPASWLHGIAYRTWVDWLRSPRRTESRTEEWWDACAAESPNPADAAIDADLEHSVFERVSELDADLRATVSLHYYQGLSLQETADALGIAASTVKHRLRQALDEIRGSLGEPATTTNKQNQKLPL